MAISLYFANINILRNQHTGSGLGVASGNHNARFRFINEIGDAVPIQSWSGSTYLTGDVATIPANPYQIITISWHVHTIPIYPIHASIVDGINIRRYTEPDATGNPPDIVELEITVTDGNDGDFDGGHEPGADHIAKLVKPVFYYTT